MIDLEHVSKEYKRGGPLALDDISLHVDDGEFVFLLGHSGAGKSTLLKLLLREELPSEGKVTVLGKDVARLRRHQVPYLRRQMGIIYQDFRLINTKTVYENVAFAMRAIGEITGGFANGVVDAFDLGGFHLKLGAFGELEDGGWVHDLLAAAVAFAEKLLDSFNHQKHYVPPLFILMRLCSG